MKNECSFRNKLTIGEVKDEKRIIKKLFNQSRIYKLSYPKDGKILNPNEMDIKEIIEYVKLNYIQDNSLDNEFDKGFLKNDLIILKNYQHDLRYDINISEGFCKFINALFLFLSTVVILNKNTLITRADEGSRTNDGELKKFSISIFKLGMTFIKSIFKAITTYKGVSILVVITFIASLSYFLLKHGKKSKSNKLKTINQAIRVLETIEKEIDSKDKNQSRIVNIKIYSTEKFKRR